MTKDKDFSLMRQVPEPTITQRVLGNLMAPIGMVRVAMQLLMLPFENNVVKKYPGEDRSRVVKVSQDISVTKMKV
jgi:hypothetical protein